MMLEEKIKLDYMQAFKDKNIPAKEVLGLVKSAIQNKVIETQKPVDDDTVLDIICKEAKAIKETIWYLQQAGKDISHEEAKLAVLSAYLPVQLTQEETKVLVENMVAEHDITDIQSQRWKLIGLIMWQHKGQVDADVVQQIISWMIE